MPYKRIADITVENAEIQFKNFSGKEKQFNAAGEKNFCVLFDVDIGTQLEKDGWNIRWLRPRDENDDVKACLQVKVSFDNVPPRVVLITGHGKTNLTEETIMSLDWAEIVNVDVIIRPYQYNIKGKAGVKAYVKALYVTIAEDKFEDKYYNVPDSAQKPEREPVGD